MIKDTLSKIEQKVKNADAIGDKNKDQLLDLLSTLEKEVTDLAQTDQENAESITNFAKVSTHEATKQEKDQSLLDLSLRGFAGSVDKFEASHPQLTEVVNRISYLLASMGI